MVTHAIGVGRCYHIYLIGVIPTTFDLKYGISGATLRVFMQYYRRARYGAFFENHGRKIQSVVP